MLIYASLQWKGGRRAPIPKASGASEASSEDLASSEALAALEVAAPLLAQLATDDTPAAGPLDRCQAEVRDRSPAVGCASASAVLAVPVWQRNCA